MQPLAIDKKKRYMKVDGGGHIFILQLNREDDLWPRK